jgi:integrase
MSLKLLDGEIGGANIALAYRLLRAFIHWYNDTKTYKGIVLDDAYKARAVRTGSNTVIASYLQTLLLTGPRREELETLKWDDINFDWNSMTLRDKVEGDRTIPLTPFVKSLMSALPRKGQWVFSSAESESGHLEEPTKAHIAALEAAGLPHVSLHGLRRSFSTLSDLP